MVVLKFADNHKVTSVEKQECRKVLITGPCPKIVCVCSSHTWDCVCVLVRYVQCSCEELLQLVAVCQLASILNISTLIAQKITANDDCTWHRLTLRWHHNASCAPAPHHHHSLLTSLPLPARHPPQDIVPAPIDRSLAPGDRHMPSACWSCPKERCPKVQSALASLSATLHLSAKPFVNHNVVLCSWCVSRASYVWRCLCRSFFFF